MNRRKRLTALLLALAMCLSILPANVLAVELGSEEEATEAVESKDSGEPVEAEEAQTIEEEETVQEPEKDESPSTMAATSGKCGKNVTWKLDSKGTLTISGTGEMHYYGYGDQPWYSNRGKIKSVVIKNGLTSISSFTFCDCNKLTSVTIPNSVTSIYGDAFYNCDSLTKLNLPRRLTNIWNTDGGAFFACNKLASISVEEGNKAYASENGVLYNKNKSVLIRYPEGKKGSKVVIPNGVKEIDYGAFVNCNNITKIDIPDGLISIKDDAFINCTKLTRIVIPNSVTNIGDCTFTGCDQLTQIYFEGAAPDISEGPGFNTMGRWGAFTNLTATAYYPENDPTWTSDKLKDYGGNITWKTWNPVFDAAVYQAESTLERDTGYEENSMFQGSPSKTLYDCGEKEGLTNSTKAWKAVTKTLDAMDKPSTMLDDVFEKKDMYSAIVLSVFEAGNKKSHTITQYSDQAVKWSGKLLGYLKKAMKLKYNIELTKTYDLSKLTKEQRQSLFTMANEWLENQDTLLKKALEGVDLAGKVMECAKEFVEWCDYVSSCAMLVSMDCYNKQIMRNMYQKATDSDLKAALKDCIAIMESNQVELYINEMTKLGEVTVKKVLQFGMDACWELAKQMAAKANPYVALLWASYEKSKAACNFLFNTDKISENYCKMEVLVQFEKVLLTVYKDTKKTCRAEMSHDNAEMFNHVYRLIYNCYDVDCQYALNFVNAIDKAAISVIAYAFGGKKSKNREELKQQIDKIRFDTNETYWNCNNVWIENLMTDYPKEYPNYKNLLHYTLSDPTITLSAQKVTYTGKSLKPSVKVKYKGEVLKAGTDYSVSYSKNKNVGTATVTVSGNGIYYGKVTKNFDIIPKGVSSVTVSNQKGKKLKVSWKKNSAVNGYEIQYALDKNYKKPKKATIKKVKETSKVISGLKKNKKYYVRVRTYQKASGKTYYSAWSKTKTVTIKK